MLYSCTHMATLGVKGLNVAVPQRGQVTSECRVTVTVIAFRSVNEFTAAIILHPIYDNDVDCIAQAYVI